jgi:undecaprenyl-diphosphatase
MPLVEALILGVVQGLTEFLPISSSAHLTLLPKLWSWESPLLNSLSFDVALHFGTLIAMLLYFGRDYWNLGRAWLRHGWQRQDPNPDARLAWYLILATLPTAILALALHTQVETWFREPAAVAGALIAGGLLLGVAEKIAARQQGLETLRLGPMLLIGLFQALAIVPGVSRSGITLTAGLLLGLTRPEATRLAFLLGLPVIAGACVFKAGDLLAGSGPETLWLVLTGMAASALSGWAVIAWLLKFVRQHTFYPFVIYRVAVGAFIIAWIWSRAVR